MDSGPVNVRMADMDVVSGGRTLKTILGSCVGIILRDAERGVAGLAHIMLPRRQRGDEMVGKFADTALPALLARITGNGGRPGALHAFIVGGAQMFPLGDTSIASIGSQNVEAVRAALREHGIPVVYEETGGTVGRAVTFDNGTGRISVRTLAPVSSWGGQS